MFPSESLALHGRPAWPALTLLIYFKRTEKVSRIQSHSNWLGFLGLSSNEENAAQSKAEGVDGTFLVNFCIIKMPSHVIFLAIVVDDSRLRVVAPLFIQKRAEEGVSS